MKSTKFLPIPLMSAVILFFFYPFFLQGKLPIPADTIIGLYHPFRDLYAKEYPRGIPFKNSLITDPVREQYPWRFLAVFTEKSLTLPLWNPYNMAGTPLLANLQSAPLYPLNVILFLPDFNTWWSVMILLQPLLAGIFMYLYLKNILLTRYSSFFGAFIYAFCGFSVAWLEWGTIGHVTLWLPLILLSIDKILLSSNKLFEKPKNSVIGRSTTIVDDEAISINNGLPAGEAGIAALPLLSWVARNDRLIWPLIFIFSLTSSFFAGHLQTFFYLFLVSGAYFIARWIQFGRQKKILITFLFFVFCFLLLASIQWFPTLQLLLQSARSIDQLDWHKEGWFLPAQHLVQFLAPDFFGNPATLNYWGVWNYGEFIGYIGIFPLIMALFALFFRSDKKTLFFGSIFFLSLFFALPTWFAGLPFKLQIPFLNTAQPTRLLFLTDFALSILAALGFDYFIRTPKKRKIIYPLIFIFLVYLSLWAFVTFASPSTQLLSENINVARRNLYFPTLIFSLITITSLLFLFIKIKYLQTIFILLMIGITIVDLFRFAYKFTPFTAGKYLFPSSSGLSFLQKNSGLSRIITTDARILPPNFSIMYHLQNVDGYDPLYLRRYGELIAAMERNKPDIRPPFGFNRIITPHNYDTKIADLLGIKYILSLSDLSSPKLVKVFEEGETKIYENNNAFERVFFIREIYPSSDNQRSINAIFDKNIDLRKIAIVENWDSSKTKFINKNNKAEITKYISNEVTVKTNNQEEGFLVLTDTFYPTWHAKICNNTQDNCQETKIYLTDYNFRGIIVPKGEHVIIYYNTLL
ncbi:YfhO family protein [Patescibacteria group bacterium]|nr:YfhO family protein [Patescibacteria group bacterium]